MTHHVLRLFESCFLFYLLFVVGLEGSVWKSFSEPEFVAPVPGHYYSRIPFRPLAMADRCCSPSRESPCAVCLASRELSRAAGVALALSKGAAAASATAKASADAAAADADRANALNRAVAEASAQVAAAVVALAEARAAAATGHAAAAAPASAAGPDHGIRSGRRLPVSPYRRPRPPSAD